mmetsp:Transcript_4285/g.6107  ORF Transcript_4285/g.6107 Transcript_4285/m.6107 type:complete len:323 (+) Transcript_4285:383-1351(+)|eukprot:CAMPEP_0184479944 /NCGR_PEP_ID=MMETSP0113_2-20130426/1458_1 /TAXON_ID=91329 /ORGANISM="Norrisiella sphaerica, Strain BC52" /LENGTH=322 /DNA_ID=CAMNT_0026858121 /DNA_START=320 /DNA_END=1288 /DNA_ORIENTATION=-
MSSEGTPILGSNGKRKFTMGEMVAACVAAMVLGALLLSGIVYMFSGSSDTKDLDQVYVAKVWKKGNVTFYMESPDPNADFSYQDAANWKFTSCKGNGMQSPIDLGDATNWGIASNLTPLKLKYREMPLRITNNGKYIFFDFSKSGNKLFTPTGNYTMLDIRFHTPSEHSLNGARYPMEIQFYHLNHHYDPDDETDNNKYAVMSVFVKQGKTNHAFPNEEYKFNQFLPRVTGVEHNLEKPLDINDLLPTSREQYLYYEGSLTAPPCSENVKWFVYTNPIEMSKVQIDTFEAVAKTMPAADKNGHNARPTQSKGARAVLVTGTG